MSWKTVRFALCMAVASCMAVVLPVQGATAASAATVTAAHQGKGGHGRGQGPVSAPGFGNKGKGGGGGGFGPGFFRGFRSTSETGIVLTSPASTLSSTSFTITQLSGRRTWTVQVSSSTKYRQPGVSSPGIGNVLAGEEVVATGRTRDRRIEAKSVVIPSVLVKGTVATSPAPASTGFTLTSTSSTIPVLKDTTVTVNVTSTTKYLELFTHSPTVQSGDVVTALVEQSGTTTVTAFLVDITAPSRHHRGYSSGGGGPGSGGGSGGGGSGWGQGGGGGSGGGGNGGGGPGSRHHGR
ncbi:MAG TPA: hypothetical protein VL984_04635 [Acidimicrobiales bacterium]|nr:hypothetical protein [Acidimicrobiales bacterium]